MRAGRRAGTGRPDLLGEVRSAFGRTSLGAPVAGGAEESPCPAPAAECDPERGYEDLNSPLFGHQSDRTAFSDVARALPGARPID